MTVPTASIDLFDGSALTPEILVRRLYWLINWHIQRRRPEVAAKLGLHRNTLHRYCSPSDLCDAHGGGPGGKLTTTMRIVEALDLDWLVVQSAIINARTENEMLDLVHVERSIPQRSATTPSGAPNALPL